MYLYGRKITIDHTKVSGDQTNFPTLISGTYDYLATVANGGKVTNASGFDIIFTSDADGLVKLDHEIELYTAATGQIVMWVKIPSLSSTVDTDIYVWYGDATVTTSQENVAGLWGSNSEAALYHFKTGAETTDVKNAHTLTAIGVPIQGTPKWGTGAVGLGTSQAFSAVDGADFQPAGNWSVSKWIRTTKTGATQIFFQTASQNTAIAGIKLYVSTANVARVISGKNSGTTLNTDYVDYAGSTTVTDGAWHHVVGTYDGAKVHLYLDGAEQGTGVAWTNAAVFAATNYVRVGCGSLAGTNANYFQGSLDETSFFPSDALSLAEVQSLYAASITDATNATILAKAKAVYLFEEGAQLTDSTAYGHTLTAIGTPTTLTTKFNGSVFLGNSSAYSSVDHADFKPTGNFTFGCWLKSNYTAAQEYIFQSWSVNTAYAGIAVMTQATTGRLLFYSGKNTGTTNDVDVKYVLHTTNVCNEVWHFCVFVWDGSYLKISVDGGAFTSAAWANAPVYAATNYVRVGARCLSGSNASIFQGQLDDVFLLNGTALSDGYILTKYNSQNFPSTFYAIADTLVYAETDDATVIGQTSATLNGYIATGTNVTTRGFQYNTTPYPSMTVSEDGTFTPGAFSLDIEDLTPGQTYYFRAFATNASGTDYGEWVQFQCLVSTYNITIAGVNRTADIINQSIVVEDAINDKVNTCNFKIIDRQSLGAPATDDEIVITLANGTKLFAGYIIGVSLQKQATGVVEYAVNCVDYAYILDRYLAHISYTDQTDAAIISDLINTYCVGLGITTGNVVEGVTINSIKFNYIQISQVLKRISQLTNRNWYIDYDKDIHYFPLTTNVAPFDITSAANDYTNLSIKKDASQLKNRVYVRGGTKLSDPTTYSVKGDGVARQFPLPDKPHDVSVTVGGVAKSVGIKNIDTTGYDWYLNFQEKYIEQDAGGTVLSTATTLAVTYTYDIPILVAVEDTASILANGVKEFAIFDKTIDTTQAARDRASAELTDYASDIIEGSFITHTAGFRSGQYININLSDYDVNADYIVQKVTARAIGAGVFYYTVSIASSKTLGIISFLIGLLEANKNLVELDDSEVVDELLAVQDSLLSDSLTEALTIDSCGAYFTWCTDSLDSTPITRARHELFQWG